ncbi:hypothetical protein NUACC21_07920 [Scytonema sp. NUACC21]
MSNFSPLESAVLITIIGETVLKDRIVKLLKSHSVSGYTISQVQGEGFCTKKPNRIMSDWLPEV